MTMKDVVLEKAIEAMFDPTVAMTTELLDIQIMNQRSQFVKNLDYLSPDEKKSYIFTGKLPNSIKEMISNKNK